MKKYFDISATTKGNNNYYIMKAPKGFGRFVHHIKCTLSVYSGLKIHNIFYDTDTVTIKLEMDHTIRYIIISNYIVEEMTARLENDRYCNDSVIDLFDTQLKLRTLEAFYATQIFNQNS